MSDLTAAQARTVEAIAEHGPLRYSNEHDPEGGLVHWRPVDHLIATGYLRRTGDDIDLTDKGHDWAWSPDRGAPAT